VVENGKCSLPLVQFAMASVGGSVIKYLFDILDIIFEIIIKKFF